MIISLCQSPFLLVEFPCVLIDVSAGKITDEFQQYVQPQERPLLSSFCTELTGIVQVGDGHIGLIHVIL